MNSSSSSYFLRILDKFLSSLAILYGLIGVIMIISALFWLNTNPVLSNYSDFQNSTNQQFQSMSNTMEDASIAADNAARSIRTSKDAIKTGSSSAREISSSLGSVADLLDTICVVNVLGCGDAISNLESKASQSGKLAENLNQTARGLDANAKDMQRLSTDFENLSKNMQNLSESFSSFMPYSASKIKLIANLVLAWLFLMHLLVLVGGLRLYLA